jgi:hypothetical protein
MAINSNKYIQKISSQHPTALWSLDDESYYVKLMSDIGRDFVNWENLNADTVTNIIPDNIVLPRPDRPCSSVVGLEIGNELDFYGSVYLVSNETFTSQSGSFDISFNLYSYGNDIRYVNIGYQVGATKNISAVFGKTGDNTQVTYQTYGSHGFSDGDYVTVTGTVPNSPNPGAYDQEGTVERVSSTRFRINSTLRYRTIIAQNEPGGEAFAGEMTDASDMWLAGQNDKWLFLSGKFDKAVSEAKIRLKIFYDGDYEKTFLINGIDVGENSLKFVGKSSGQTPIELPSDIATDETHGVPAENYLSNSDKGYYIVKNNILCSENSSIPVVYGSSNTTVLLTNDSGPSLIVPGFGFLNDYGINKTYNFETFVRINGSSTSPKRIIGPLQSDDGVYIDGSFITLKINNLYKSVFIGEWYRAMLLNIQYSPDNIELWINAEKLITINLQNENIIFPKKISTSETYLDKNQDWIGFYCYDELSSIEVDTIAIYTYLANQSILKQRLLYAQAAKTSILENQAIQNNGEFFNFQYPSANYNKNYNYPTFSKWDNARILENLAIKNNALCNIEYELPAINIGTVSEDVWLSDLYSIQNEDIKFINLKPNSAYDNIYGYMYFDSTNILQQPISSIYAVVKKPTSSETEQRILTIYNSYSKKYFKISIVGSKLSYVLNSYGEDTEIYSTSTSIIDNKISVGINLDVLKNSDNYELSSFFTDNNLSIYVGGMPNTEYTFDGNIYKFGICNSTNSLDIYSSFNEDGIILPDSLLENNVCAYTLFCQTVFNNLILDIKTKSYWESSVSLLNLAYYDVDIPGLNFFQLNIDYPENTNIVNEQYDTSNEIVKSYISFQQNSSGLSQSVFNSVVPLSQNRTIDARIDWVDNKYEFIDHTLVYVPSEIDVKDYSVVIHLDLISNVYTKPINLKYLELASKVTQKDVPSTVTSPSGNPVEHFSIDENELLDYQNSSGILITKESTSYLNLNNKSGIKIVGIS